ncbi:hypothetical protein D3C71_872470 [compost metagenome]
MADIQPGRRLVEQHDRRLLRQYHCNPRALPLTAGQRIDALPCQIGDPRCLHRAGHGLFIFFPPAGKQWLMRIPPARYQLLHGDIPRRGGVLRQQSNPPCHLFAGIALDLLPVEKHAAVLRRHQTAQGAQQSRFSAAVRADNRREMAVRNRDAQVVDHDFFTVAEGQFFAAQAGCCGIHFLRDSWTNKTMR